MKYITLYTVVDRKNPQVSFTITKTKKEAFEYLHKKVQVDNLAHFVSWCELRDYDSNSLDVWNEYARKVLSPEDFFKYAVKKVRFPFEKVIPIMRVYFECLPLGCSFDDPLELETILNAVDPKTAEKIQQQLSEEEKADGTE